MKAVPFFANTADGTHCVQAAFRMMLKYFLPGRDFSWVQLDKMSHKVAGKGTWWFPMVLELEKLGLQAKLIEFFDYERFQKQGNSYVLEIFAPEVAYYHLKSSNLTDVKEYIPEFLQLADYEFRAAKLKDLDEILNAGWLAALDVNSRTLNSRQGYSGHVIVVYGKAGQNYLIHDPGLPPKPGQKVSKDLLLEAWQYSGKANTAMFAVGAKSN